MTWCHASPKLMLMLISFLSNVRVEFHSKATRLTPARRGPPVDYTTVSGWWCHECHDLLVYFLSAVLFWGVSHSLPLTFDLKLLVGAVFIGKESRTPNSCVWLKYQLNIWMPHICSSCLCRGRSPDLLLQMFGFPDVSQHAWLPWPSVPDAGRPVGALRR